MSLSLKLLVKSAFAGCLIGSQGSAIKELMDITHAKVQVSGQGEYYPGSTDRVLLISGSPDEINNAIAVIIELLVDFSLNSQGTRDWSPSALLARAKTSDGYVNSVEEGVKIAIPAAAAGLVIGTGGSNLKSFCETSQAKAFMNSKDDAVFTSERILTVNGYSGEIKGFIELVLQKLGESPELATYVNKGTRYYANNSTLMGGGRRSGPGASASHSHHHHAPRAEAPAAPVEGVIDSEISIVMTVSEDYIGFLLGKKGATLKEMKSLTKANIEISNREDMDATERTRTVTISGSVKDAQLAHRLCTERIRQGQKGRSTEA